MSDHLSNSEHIRIVAVCGEENTGKTALIERLVHRMSELGIQVAVIKHYGRDFQERLQGTDTYELAGSGAYGTAEYSGDRMVVYRQGTGETEADLIQMFPEADVILIEGLRNSGYPKIEVIRKEAGPRLISNPEGRFLIVTDLPKDTFQEAVLGFDEIDEIIEKIAV